MFNVFQCNETRKKLYWEKVFRWWHSNGNEISFKKDPEKYKNKTHTHTAEVTVMSNKRFIEIRIKIQYQLNKNEIGEAGKLTHQHRMGDSTRPFHCYHIESWSNVWFLPFVDRLNGIGSDRVVTQLIHTKIPSQKNEDELENENAKKERIIIIIIIKLNWKDKKRSKKGTGKNRPAIRPNISE